MSEGDWLARCCATQLGAHQHRHQCNSQHGQAVGQVGQRLHGLLRRAQRILLTMSCLLSRPLAVEVCSPVNG